MALFLCGLAARAGFGTFRLVEAAEPAALEFPDEQQYWQMAASLAAGDGLRDELGFQATRMPLYPGLLSLLTGVEEGVIVAKAAQWLVGALAAVFTAGLAFTLFQDRKIAVLAGLLVAVDPFLVFFSSLLLTETLFITLLTALWWYVAWLLTATGVRCRWRVARLDAPLRQQGSTAPHEGESVPEGGRIVPASWWRRMIHWCVAGVIATLCVYTRESALGLIAGSLIVMALVCGARREVAAGGAALLAVVVLALVPWAVRNRAVLGEWCWLTTRAGISLYDGVRPDATGASDLGDVKQMAAVRGLSESEWNEYFLRESMGMIREEPARVARLALVKAARMWNPLPNVETYQSALVRVISGGWTLPTFAAALLGIGVLRRRAERGCMAVVVYLVLPALYLTVLHSLFVGSVRYRLGAIPMLEVLAAVAIVALIDRLVVGRTRSIPCG